MDLWSRQLSENSGHSFNFALVLFGTRFAWMLENFIETKLPANSPDSVSLLTFYEWHSQAMSPWLTTWCDRVAVQLLDLGLALEPPSKGKLPLWTEGPEGFLQPLRLLRVHFGKMAANAKTGCTRSALC